MDNYISINNQKIELNDDQVKLIVAAAGKKVELGRIAAGDTFKIGEHEFVVLEQYFDTTAVICKNLINDDQVFGENNNYNGSHVDEFCNSFAQFIASVVGQENLVQHMVDLTSDDGLKDYGVIDRQVSLLTADQYRRYVEILDRHKVDSWWWLATPFSTATHGYARSVKCVSPSGCIDNFYCNYVYGVRPFCILKSNIFVSK